MSLLCSFLRNHTVCHLLTACAHCSGTVWAAVHFTLTRCPCQPPVHLFTPPPPPPNSGSRVASSLACCDCTNLSLVSTSKQKRLSMESVLRRMQDFRVRCVGPCGGSKVGNMWVHVMETMTGKITEKIPYWIYLIIGTDNAVKTKELIC